MVLGHAVDETGFWRPTLGYVVVRISHPGHAIRTPLSARHRRGPRGEALPRMNVCRSPFPVISAGVATTMA